MVEFCIGGPLLLLLMFGVIEIGEILIQSNRLADSARDAAGYLSRNALLGSTGVVNLNFFEIRTAQNLAVYGNGAGIGRPLLPNLNPGEVFIRTDAFNNVSVTIDYPYESLFGGAIPLFFRAGAIFTGGLVLNAYTSMRAL